jgi:hypothetical protein
MQHKKVIRVSPGDFFLSTDRKYRSDDKNSDILSVQTIGRDFDKEKA